MIVVTGAYGCLGSNVVRALLERGERVVALRREGESADSLADVAGDVEDVVVDIRDADGTDRALRGRTGLFHLAGVAVMTNKAARAMHEVNVVGTAHVMSAARRHGLRTVHTSSASAVGFPAPGVTADEDHPYRADRRRNAYQHTKRAGERIVLGEVARGLDAVVLNPAGVIAPGGDGRSAWPGLVARVAAGRFPLSPPGGFSFVAAEEFRAAQLAAYDKGAAGRRYIVATEYLRYHELFARIAQRTGARAPRGTVPSPVLRALAIASAPINAWIGSPERALLMSSENLPMLTGELRYSPRRCRTELGVEPGDMNRALDDVVAWCRRHRYI